MSPVTPSPVPDRVPASQAAFLDDVGRVLRVWRRAPLAPDGGARPGARTRLLPRADQLVSLLTGRMQDRSAAGH